MNQIQMIPVDQIVPAIVQPRLPQNEEQLMGLSSSIGEHGVIQAATVYWDNSAGKYRLVHGERRWRAAQLAGQTDVPCVVKEPLGLADFLLVAVAENGPREDLSPLEKAWALKTYYLLANLQALAAKYGELVYLEQIEQEAEAVATKVSIIDERDQTAARQQEIIDYLEYHLREALALIGKRAETWKGLVSWDTCVQKLGFSYLDPRRRRQILEVLGLAKSVQSDVADSAMTEYAMRGLANHPPEIQEKIVGAAVANDDLDNLTHAAVQEMAAQFAAADVKETGAAINGTAGTNNGKVPEVVTPIQETASVKDAASEKDDEDTIAGSGRGLNNDDPFRMYEAIDALRLADEIVAAHYQQWPEHGQEMVIEWLLGIAEDAGIRLTIAESDTSLNDVIREMQPT